MTQRTAERPAGMNLDWHAPVRGTWKADLPAIPGYTGADGNGSFVTVVYNGETELAVPYDADCTIFLSRGGVVNLNLWDMWAFDPFGPDAKDVMQAVDDLGVSDISDELKRMGYEPDVDEDGEYVTASRSERTARMDLNWDFNANMLLYEAALPAIPGYPGVDSVDVWKDDEKPGDHWCFSLCQNGYPLSIRSNEDFGIPDTATAEEMMDIVDNLSLRDIADMLDDMGYGPIDNPTAARHATRRTASLDLDWEKDDEVGDWHANLPAIPGYPCAGGYSNHVQVADQSGLEGTDWAFYMYLELQKETVHLYNEDFGIPDTATAEEMMDIIENLSLEDIADALQAEGYMPEEE